MRKGERRRRKEGIPARSQAVPDFLPLDSSLPSVEWLVPTPSLSPTSATGVNPFLGQERFPKSGQEQRANYKMAGAIAGTLFNHHTKSREYLLFSSLYTWRNQGSQKLRTLHMIIQSVAGGYNSSPKAFTMLDSLSASGMQILSPVFFEAQDWVTWCWLVLIGWPSFHKLLYCSKEQIL